MDELDRRYRSRKVAGDVVNPPVQDAKQKSDAFQVPHCASAIAKNPSLRSRHSAIVGEEHPILMKTRGRCLRAPRRASDIYHIEGSVAWFWVAAFEVASSGAALYLS